MALPDRKIVAFIRKHHVLTLATSVKNRAWCSNIFYTYVEKENLFVFTSDAHTKHASDAVINPHVAASIVLESRVIGRLQGLQIEGVMRQLRSDEAGLKRAYLKRFPYAAAVELSLWAVEPSYFKMTDNTLGFGKKLIWEGDKSGASDE